MTIQPPHFLLISAAPEGEAWVQASLSADATMGGVTITRAASTGALTELLRAAQAAPFDLVLADLSFDGMQAREIVELLQTELPDVPVVLLAGEETLAAAVDISQDVTAPVVLQTADSRPLLPGAVHSALRTQRGRGLAARPTASADQPPRHDFFTGSQVAMLLIDPDSLEIRDANAAACDFYGYARGELAGRNIGEMTLMPTPRALRDAFANSLGADGAPFTCRQRLASGEMRDVELFSSAIPLDGRTTLHTVVHDITERQLMQQALRRSEERFKRIAENAPDMIFRWSYAQGFEYVNPASTEVIGYTPEEHYQDPGLGYRSIHIDDLPIYESVFSDLADPEGPRRYCVIRWIHKTGHIVHVEMRMTPIFDEHGNLLAIEGIARDISQHVHQRERLRELTGRLTRAHEEERRRLARELHDEVGQALTIARMRTRMLHKSIPEEAIEVRDRLGVLDDLIQEMLRNVRALSHELRPPLLDEMGWRPAVEALCDSFSQRTGLPVSFRASGTGDSERLPPDVELVAYRVVQEALTNIARHAEASRATVTAHLIEDGLRLVIEDDGVGFDADAVTRITGPDAGLGLLGMQERIDTVGGRVRLDSAPGRGTRIHAHLPREVIL